MQADRKRLQCFIVRLVGLVLVTVIVFSEAAQASVLTFSFRGIVTDEVSTELSPPIVPKTPFFGSYTFESTARDGFVDDPLLGVYDIQSFSLTLLGNTYSLPNPGSSSIYVDKFNDPLADKYVVYALGLSGPFVNHSEPNIFTLVVGGHFIDDSLPLTPPSLGVFPSGNRVRMEFIGADSLLSFSGQLTSLTLTPVPLPGTLLMFGSSLFGLAGLLVRHRMRTEGNREESQS